MARLAFCEVTVDYPVYNSRNMSLRSQLLRWTSGGRIEREAGRVSVVRALDRVTFELRDGDSVGLFGQNGSGKTTLLRTMAGIYSPSSGTVVREGSVATVFDIGAGMNPELSGYDNIIRMGRLMGLGRREAEALIPDVAEFTELGSFLQMPVRTYSAGMTMRLMFAVATSVRPQILLVDEMFGTGDGDFQKKARSRMRSLVAKAEIVVLASHALDLLLDNCNRFFELQRGAVTEVAREEVLRRARGD